MELVVATHPAAEGHDTGRNHPERPAREAAVRRGLDESALTLVPVTSAVVDRVDLEAVHDSGYIDMVEAFCRMGGGALDMDTIASPGSWNAALTAAGAVRSVAENLQGREDAVGYAVTRPPGHHALRDQAMGFCLFNNVVIGSTWMRASGHRVAIIDWDVHHGNGTEAMVAADPGVLYISIHQSPFYPFEGVTSAIDRDAVGTTINLPLPAGTAGDVYRQAWKSIVLPVLGSFAPDWLLVSAGYDAHHQDPLAGMRLVDDDFAWMAGELARSHPTNRTIFVLEGGYDLDALRGSARATVEGAAGVAQPGSPLTSVESSRDALRSAAAAVSRHHHIG